MISLIRNIVFMLGKRGELRNKDILLTPQLSSSFRMLKFLSSCVLLFKKLVIVMPRFGTNRPGIFELGRNKIGRSFDVFWRKRGMTLVVGIFSLFLLFPNVSNSAVYFLPDAQSDEIFSSSPIASIDSVRCEEVGYTYYSSGACPAYHNQDTCVFSDKYLKCDATGWCRDNSYTISSCTSPKVVNTQCPNGLSLYKSCVCPSTYKYACTGTGYSSGNGTVCDGKYTKCNCSSLYDWTGSACIHTHSYSCPSGYSASSSGMISPASTAKTCACGATSGSCYKETHSHSYSCTSGYSSSCSYGYWGTASKKCSCGATSGTCYSCKSYCEANPCGSGCYTNLSCTYGCASTNSCGGCNSCASNPCASVSCPSAVSCTYGCASYSSSTSCCSSVCTSCKGQCDANPCASGCYTNKSCTYGCASTNSCGGCESCKSAPACTPLSNETGCSYGTESCSDGCGGTRTCCKANPCASVTCPTAKSCAYGCASYSSSTSCCSSVCTSCNSAPACVDVTCSTPAGCSPCSDCSSCKGTVTYCRPYIDCEYMAANYYCCS